MNSSNRLTPILLKATSLATILFWTLLSTEDIGTEIYFFIIPSIIPIAIVCSLTVVITIMPFFGLDKENAPNNKIFKKYFPYYSSIAFSLCSYFIYTSNFEKVVCAFFITAFFTLMQSWVWLCKVPADLQKKNTNLKNIRYDEI
jgi:hypothetical protein